MAAWRVCTAFGSKPSRAFVPVGGEDLDRVQGGTRLVRAWRDEAGVTCRRWNWRQGPRPRLTEETVSGVFLLEAMAPMPRADMERAATELAELLEKFGPGAWIEVATAPLPRAPAPE
ncbi:conserved hypothetical protein [Streptomyces sviceus ATCC 29083]|uniref:Uncharacterized protein n=1 Tax=Streptomyces sviceus (strain ATCC 29083 / DSM 924 / JCM 4929 / NBRC 13980 / NCIMB 11184 / NRRL 5439 / UC 5370) TaxID=463191 RepID=B5I6C2_STRX2|nr:conserved hypothetical protein [Streptomyces sviceus ATCC 29083]